MICKEIIKVLEANWPPEYALDWDNVGLLVGREEKKVSRIYVTLDVTDTALAQAQDWGADLIVSHHPLIFSAVKQINNRTFLGRRILRLAAGDTAYYAMHTNFDVTGMAQLNQASLNLKETSVLMVTCREENQEEGIGRVGLLPEEMTLGRFAEYVKEKLHLPQVLVYGEQDRVIRTAAISGGSGKSVVKPAVAAGAQVLVTGDIDYHTGIDAVAEGLAVVDAGHYGTEAVFIPYMTEQLQRLFPELEVRGADIVPPFVAV